MPTRLAMVRNQGKPILCLYFLKPMRMMLETREWRSKRCTVCRDCYYCSSPDFIITPCNDYSVSGCQKKLNAPDWVDCYCQPNSASSFRAVDDVSRCGCHSPLAVLAIISPRHIHIVAAIGPRQHSICVAAGGYCAGENVCR